MKWSIIESTKESRIMVLILVFMFCVSKGNKSHLRKFIEKWFEPYKIQYVLPNNIMLLVTIEKFETNLVLVNVNKFKPYKYMESEVHNKNNIC